MQLDWNCLGRVYSNFWFRGLPSMVITCTVEPAPVGFVTNSRKCGYIGCGKKLVIYRKVRRTWYKLSRTHGFDRSKLQYLEIGSMKNKIRIRTN